VKKVSPFPATRASAPALFQKLPNERADLAPDGSGHSDGPRLSAPFSAGEKPVCLNRAVLRGRKPYGYYEGEDAALERLKSLQAEGLGFDRIAARMNEERIPTRTGRPWHGVVINRILSGKR